MQTTHPNRAINKDGQPETSACWEQWAALWAWSHASGCG